MVQVHFGRHEKALEILPERLLRTPPHFLVSTTEASFLAAQRL